MVGLKDFKNYKRKAPVFGCILDCQESRKVIMDIALKVGLSGNENEFERLLFPIEQSGSPMEIPAAVDPSPENYIDEEDWSWEEESVIEEDDDACVAV